MSSQLHNQLFLSPSPPSGLADSIGLVPHLLHTQVNSPALHHPNSDGRWQDLRGDAPDDTHCRLLVDTAHSGDNHDQQVPFAATSFAQLQGQSMAQTAQIVLLPTQNINLVASVPKQEQVQMIVPNEVGYQLLTSIPNVSVLVPTNLLLTNGYILINNSSPDSGPCPATTVLAAETAPASPVTPSLYLNQWAGSERPVEHDPHLVVASVELEGGGTAHHLAQECEYIALADTATQTVLGAMPEADLNQATHLISSNGQIVGIIGSDQLSILQGEPAAESQVLIATCIDPHEGGLTLASGPVESASSYDINAILASTIATAAVEKTDAVQAKQWLRDSCIVNRALKALKKTDAGAHHHHASNRPHAQARR